jgi:RNA ligase (TIGR02306 family)
MGITKYEPPEPSYQNLGGQKSRKRNPNPNFKVYTDIQNIKNHTNVFKEGDRVYISEKIHGTNFRAGKVPIESKGIIGWIKRFFIGTHEFVIGSHNVQLEGTAIGNWFKKRPIFYGENVYAKIAKKYGLAEIISPGLILYGEIYGKGIQELEYGLTDIDIAFFDLMVDGKYVGYSELKDFCDKNKLPIVPKLYVGPFSQHELDYCTNGNSMFWPNQIREGCVVKSLIESNDPRIGRKVLKSINDEYLLKQNRTDFH